MNRMVHKVYRMMKGKDPMDLRLQHIITDMSAFTGYSGKIPSISYTWIVDSGASSDMCYQQHLFINLKYENKEHAIHLPDGSVKKISYKGTIELNGVFSLMYILYVPGF